MSSPKAIWVSYDAYFKQTIAQAERKEQIEQFYYKFKIYLSEQKYSIKDIEGMEPMMKEAVDHAIKTKFMTSERAKCIERLSQEESKQTPLPILIGQPDDKVTFETDLRVYNRLAKWINRENVNMQYKLTKSDRDTYRGPYKGKMWLKVVP
jgi:transcriptional accessory protein Tex/SPT6